MLSDESRRTLEALLPPTAFTDFIPSTDLHGQFCHQDATGAGSPKRTLNFAVFNDSYFLDAAHTFQDHLCSDWLSSTHTEKVNTYLDGIRDGTMASPWKDDVWERDNPRPNPVPPADSESVGTAPVFNANARAG